MYHQIEVTHSPFDAIEIQRDQIRAHPSFRGRPVFDFVLIDSPHHGHYVGQVQLLFTMAWGSTDKAAQHPVALVDLYEIVGREDRKGETGMVSLRYSTGRRLLPCSEIKRRVLVQEKWASSLGRGEVRTAWILNDLVDKDIWHRMDRWNGAGP